VAAPPAGTPASSSPSGNSPPPRATDSEGEGAPIRIEAVFEAGRPAGLTPGTPLDGAMAITVGPLPLEPGGVTRGGSLSTERRMRTGRSGSLFDRPPSLDLSTSPNYAPETPAGAALFSSPIAHLVFGRRRI
jgi:hypothetical protein